MNDALPILRVARHTDALERLGDMYAHGLGFRVLSRFVDHEGFDGVILGHPQAPYHLEFTRQRGHAAPAAPPQGSLLVFYHPDPADWEAACERMREAGFVDAGNENPHWETQGATFRDPDGYRVVLARQAWQK